MLCAIVSDYRGALLKEVNVVKETPKQYTLSDEGVYRSKVNKSDLYKCDDYNMFGTDKDLLIKTWNEAIDKKIKRHEEMIEKSKGKYIIGE